MLLGPRRLRERASPARAPGRISPLTAVPPQIVLEFMRRGSADTLLWKPDESPIELRWERPLLGMAEDCAAAM